MSSFVFRGNNVSASTIRSGLKKPMINESGNYRSVEINFVFSNAICMVSDLDSKL